MSYLLDTNILLRSIDFEHPMNALTLTTIERLLTANEDLIIAPQNLIELWNVFTRPLTKNGLGKTSADTKQEVQKLKTTFIILSETPAIYPI